MIKNAIILAAGLGSRLRPFTDTVPKCLTKIKNKPILITTLEALEKVSVDNVVIVVGHLGDVIIKMQN